MKFKEYDIIVVGSGVSGLYTALNLDCKYKILLLSKNELMKCNSALAQGGVAAVMDSEKDDFKYHFEDTLIAGGYENNRENLDILVRQGPFDVKNLLSIGVPFDKKPDGTVDLTLEGGHSRNRIAHHKDSTGSAIVSKLIERVKELKNVDIMENSQLLNLIKESDDFLLDVYFNGEHCYYTTKVCVLATGGIGRVYEYTTNSVIATGDGICFAYNMGAKITDLSLIQFHPTAFATKERECFLISEAVRGEGARLLNCKKEQFMHRYDKRGELAPRDVVSEAILAEEKLTGNSEFFLDISHKDSDFIKKRFPMIYERVLLKGYDMTKEPIPIYPCQHYLMGGIAVDGKGLTTVRNLYAAGECAYTGIHGRNRLASNSLLEALVFSRLIAEDINKKLTPKGEYEEIEFQDYMGYTGENIPKGYRREVRKIMQKAFFVTPDIAECKKGLERIREMREDLEITEYSLSPELIEVKSLVTVAYIILKDVTEKAERQRKTGK